MIQPNELKIGNWVSYIEYNQPCYIKEINLDGLRVCFPLFKEESWIEIEQFQPIPLTTEILEKAGFEKIERSSFSSGDKQIIYSYTKSDITYNAFQDAWWYGIVLKTQPKYLHQLQNLYFALTGEELNITL